MASLLAELLNILASWLGLGLLFALVLILKGWTIVADYRRARKRQNHNQDPPTQ